MNGRWGFIADRKPICLFHWAGKSDSLVLPRVPEVALCPTASV